MNIIYECYVFNNGNYYVGEIDRIYVLILRLFVEIFEFGELKEVLICLWVLG